MRVSNQMQPSVSDKKREQNCYRQELLVNWKTKDLATNSALRQLISINVRVILHKKLKLNVLVSVLELTIK